MIDEMGRIRIIDRRKNVLKLAQGEYISPERLEACSCPPQLSLLRDTFTATVCQTLPGCHLRYPARYVCPLRQQDPGAAINPTDLPALQALARRTSSTGVLRIAKNCHEA